MGVIKLGDLFILCKNLISQQDVHVMFRVVLLAGVMIFMEMFMRALSKSKLKDQQHQQCRGCHLLNNTMNAPSALQDNYNYATLWSAGGSSD